MTSRRDFLRRTAFASAATLAVPLPGMGDAPLAPPADAAPTPPAMPGPPNGSAEQVAQDEAYWRGVAEQYAVTDRVTNMEAGYFV